MVEQNKYITRRATGRRRAAPWRMAAAATIAIASTGSPPFAAHAFVVPPPPFVAPQHSSQRPMVLADVDTLTRPTTTMLHIDTNSDSVEPRPTNRSSTMPGMRNPNALPKQFRDGIRIVEERTGQQFVDTPQLQKQRRKKFGEALYKNSAAVPDSLVDFSRDIHNEERITACEERQLGEKTQEAIRLQELYDQLEEKLDREPTDDEWCAAAGKINMEAIGQAIEEGLEAKNKLVSSNLRLVQSVVNTYIRNGLGGQYNAGDLMQEGILALIRAAEKFEPSRGWKFSTYAMYWVRASVKRSQIRQSRSIPVPQRLYENNKRLQKLEREMIETNGRRPTRKELGEVVGMSENQVNRCFTAMELRCFSLDQDLNNGKKPMQADSNTDALIDIIDATTVDHDSSKQQQLFLKQDIIETLHRHLTDEEVELLLLRYGLKDSPKVKHRLNGNRLISVADLSQMMGVKPDKIRRMIQKSLNQLQKAGLDEWLGFERDL